MKLRWGWALGALGVIAFSIASVVIALDFIANRDGLVEAQAHVERGVHLYVNADYPKAQADFRRAMRLDPDEWKAPFYMGIIKIHLKNYSMAIPYLERALTLNPTEPKVSNALGTAYFKLDRLDMAKAYFGLSFELDPANKNAKAMFSSMAKLQRRVELAAVSETE